MEEKSTEIVTFTAEPMEIDYWDVSNPRSICGLAKDFQEGWLKELILENREALEYLLSLDEDELRYKVRPTHDNNHLRLRFWAEYDLAQRTDCPMNFRRVFDGIVTCEAFHVQLETLGKLAWMLRPPKDYLESIEEALSSGVAKIRQILDADIKHEDGTYNTPVMNAIIKAFTVLDNRVKGLPTKTILKKSLSVNVQRASKELPKAAAMAQLTEEELLNQELMNARQDLERLKYDPRVVVLPKEDK
jgi:hypothetical protein